MPPERHTIFGPTAVKTYDALIKRCKDHVQSLVTVQFDPETGIRRHYFNEKIERTVRVRGAKNND